MSEPTSATTTRRSFVGRDDELALLDGALRDATASRGRLVALVGDAGIGKTRTVEEFVARAGLPETSLLWGRCPEHDGAPAYWPWTQALSRHVERLDDARLEHVLGAAAGDLVPLVPAIARRLGERETTPTVDPAQSRLRLFDGIASVLRRSAEGDPLVVVLDDLHWADEGSILLLSFVAQELRRARILIVATYREREMTRAGSVAAGLARVAERVTLRGLDLDETGRFVDSRVAAAPHAAIIERLHRVSAGNPFFLDELLRMLGDAALHEDGALSGTIPDGVRNVVRRNLERLSADDRDVLTIAAALGCDFELAPLRAACALPPEALLQRLDGAMRAGLVDELHDEAGRYRFSHVLIRDALEAELPPIERARLHQRIALALEELHRDAHDPPYADLARHFVHAAVLGETAKAVLYATRAGEKALTRFAYEEAIAQFEVALKALRLDRPDEPREVALRLGLGQAQAHAGQTVAARATFERAAARARTIGDAASLARAALGYAAVTPGVGAVDATLVALLEEALRLLGDEDSALRAALLGNLAGALYFSREEERRDALSSEAVAMARRIADGATLASALIQRHHMLWRPGGIAARLAVCDEIELLAELSGNRELGLHGTLWRLVDLLEAGDLATLDAALDAFTRRADHARIPMYLWFARVVHAARAFADGDLARSARLADDAYAAWPDGPLTMAGQMHMLQRFLVRAEIGGLDELEQRVRETAETYPAIPAWQSALALIDAEHGRAREAALALRGFVIRGLDALPRDSNLLSLLATLSLLAHQLEDVEAARALYAFLLPHEELYASIGLAAGTRGACSRYLGLLAETDGRLADAARHLAASVEANARLGNRPLLAATQADLARVLMKRHERGRAEALLHEVRRTCDELGLVRLRARIDGDGGAVTATPPRSTTATFRRDGASWVLTWDGRTVTVKHAKGLDYLATLLRSAGSDVHVLDLVLERGVATAGGASAVAETGTRHDAGDAGELIDAQARIAYQRRLRELEQELDEAREFNDLGRIERAQEEIDGLTAELSRAIGLGGRHRKAGAAAERARVNVSRAIAAVLKKIAEEHPALGEHLAARIHTGTFCSYTPDATTTVDWQL